MTTESEAREIKSAIESFQLKDEQVVQATHQTNIQLAKDWWETVKPTIPTTRQEALDVYNFIKNLLKTETDRYRLQLLNKKLEQANEKFKEIKASL